MCDQFSLGAQAAGHTVEKVFLQDKQVNYCIACDVCRNSGGACIHQDDMADILEKMIASDVIVMATPIYFYSIDGQKKTIIDRTYSRYTEITNKDFYFIMTAADGRDQTIQETLMEFLGFISCLNQAKENGMLFGGGAWNKGGGILRSIPLWVKQ